MIGVYIPDLTHLRYYGPIVKICRELGWEVAHIIDRRSQKYNGLALDDNYRRIREIAEEESWVIREDLLGEIDVLFTVENSGHDRFSCRKFSIQHGFDYVWHGGKDPGTTYLMCAQEYAEDLLLRHGTRSLVMPSPVTFWDREQGDSFGRRWLAERGVVLDRPLVTVLYPESGHSQVALDLCRNLIDLGYSVVVKQRRKHQSIASDVERLQGIVCTYDDSWLPSESIFLPSLSSCVVGFGSSAYTDILEMGIPYLNVDVLSGSPWSEFLLPQRDHFRSARDSLVDHIMEMTRSPIVRRPSDGRSFLEDLIGRGTSHS